MAASKRKIPGIFGESDGSHEKLTMDVLNLTKGVCRPWNAAELNTDDVIEYHLNARKDQMIRLDTQAFCMTVDIRVQNKTHDAASGDANIAATHHFMQPQGLDPPAFLDPALGGAALFSEVEVSVDGMPITTPRLGKHGFLYSAFNKVYCSERLRLEKYGCAVPRVSTEQGRKPTSVASGEAPDMKAAMESLQYDHKLNAKSKVLRFSMDGVRISVI